ncbi:M90 family metallopeptidase [Mucilaginibacter agri]|uniref:Peptidase n=1 Tax=Mucilaginibacter agri TaxID=2695265 RepID=A0A966DVJ0_9SPHI|nr:M90 family metallopeptidase [Mucilaginibacter agri]NCD71497.1 peptidase [Mucilaginibacter agri]
MNIALIALVAVIIIYLITRKKSAGAPVAVDVIPPPEHKALLQEHVSYYAKLDEAAKTRFAQMVDQFLGYVRIEGVGMDITEVDRILVASSAVIPIFGFGGWKYKNLTNVIVYPDTFDNDFQFEGSEDRNIMGMVGSGYMNGQMLLSRAALIKGFSASSGKENTAIHEFVHLLDKSDGATDGIPELLMQHQYAAPWIKLIHQEMRRIEAGKSDINPYALTNEAEFLAVVSEYFFEKPEQLKTKHPELYEQLSQIFIQDLA